LPLVLAGSEELLQTNVDARVGGLVDRADWFLCFQDAARAPAPQRASGPAADLAEWMSVFLAAANAQSARSEGAQTDERFDVKASTEERPAAGQDDQPHLHGGAP
jgi:hypothetical protein